MKLGKFVDKYIVPNANLFIYIIDVKSGVKTPILLWHGASWQCTYDKDNLRYMKKKFIDENSKQFIPCQYRNETNFYIDRAVHNLTDESSAVDIFLK